MVFAYDFQVDLLGDQVEVLLSLLHKVYSSLQNYSLILQPSVWVSKKYLYLLFSIAFIYNCALLCERIFQP